MARPTKAERAQWAAERAERDRKSKAAHDKKMAAIKAKNDGGAAAGGLAAAAGCAVVQTIANGGC